MTAPQPRPVRRLVPPHWPLWPALAALGAVFVVPVAQLLGLSLVDEAGRVSLEHYARLFQTELYVQVLASTFRIAFWTTAICVLAGYPLAYLLATTTTGRRNALLLWVLMPFWTSVLVRTFAWIVILGRRGLLNQILAGAGLAEAPLELSYNLGSVLVGMAHALMPLGVLTMLTVMQGIDPGLTRAAGTLGARGSHVFWRIYFPLSLPGVAGAALLIFISAIGFFVTPTLLGSPQETMVAQVIITQIDEMLNWGFAGAVAVLLLAASIVVFYVFDRVVGMVALTGNLRPAEGRRPGLLGRAGAIVGSRLVAGLGWAGAFAGELVDRSLRRASSDRPRPKRRTGLWAFGLAAVAYLAAPSFLLVPISFSASSFFEWPPRGFSLEWYQALSDSPLWRQALLRSVWVGGATALLSVLLGIPAAFVLSRADLRARSAILGFFLLPMVIPHIIVALALFYAFSRVRLVGTSLGLVLGHTIFALPYVVVTIMAVLRNYDTRLDQAAWTLGASRLTTFRRVTLPIIRSGVITAFLFAFIKSFDELTVALFISGAAAPTLPRQMWSDALLNVSPVLAAASTVILGLVAAGVLAGHVLARPRAPRSSARSDHF